MASVVARVRARHCRCGIRCRRSRLVSEHLRSLATGSLNDGRYNMVHHGMRQIFGAAAAYSSPPIDFSTWAGALGMPAEVISGPGELTRTVVDSLLAFGAARPPARLRDHHVRPGRPPRSVRSGLQPGASARARPSSARDARGDVRAGPGLHACGGDSRSKLIALPPSPGDVQTVVKGCSHANIHLRLQPRGTRRVGSFCRVAALGSRTAPGIRCDHGRRAGSHQ